MERAGHSHARIRALAQWWTQAQDVARFELVRRVRLEGRPAKEDPTPQELYLAIYVAESEAGEREAG